MMQQRKGTERVSTDEVTRVLTRNQAQENAGGHQQR